MFGECHAHIFLNGRNYKEAVALHKNHDPGDHDLDKISAEIFYFLYQISVFFQIFPGTSDDPAVMPFAMNGKHRAAVIDPILWCDL